MGGNLRSQVFDEIVHGHAGKLGVVPDRKPTALAVSLSMDVLQRFSDVLPCEEIANDCIWRDGVADDARLFSSRLVNRLDVTNKAKGRCPSDIAEVALPDELQLREATSRR